MPEAKSPASQAQSRGRRTTHSSDLGPTAHSPATADQLLALQDQYRHIQILQKQVLAGLGVTFSLALVALVGAPAAGFISEDYARFLAQMIIPTTLASGATIVGTLFSVKS